MTWDSSSRKSKEKTFGWKSDNNDNDDRIKRSVCVFYNVDQCVAVGNDVPFMSQDDCVQLDTLQ